MNIVCCLDDGFVMPCGVLLISICENNKEENIEFYIVSEGLKEENQRTLQEIVERYGQHINFCYVHADSLKNCPLKREFQPSYITLASYYRLLLSSVLPDCVDKILYLDCDIAVCRSLKELWHIDVNNYAIAASTNGDNILDYNRVNYDFSLGYFNAGVLLINLNYWRKNRVEEDLLEYADTHTDILNYHDQDILNYVLRERKMMISMKYNMTDRFLWKARYIFVRRSQWGDLISASQAPVIIHYIGPLKPWHKDSTSILNSVWLKYYRLSPWSGMPLIYGRTLLQRLIAKLRKVLVGLRLIGCEPNKYRDDLDKLDYIS